MQLYVKNAISSKDEPTAWNVEGLHWDKCITQHGGPTLQGWVTISALPGPLWPNCPSLSMLPLISGGCQLPWGQRHKVPFKKVFSRKESRRKPCTWHPQFPWNNFWQGIKILKSKFHKMIKDFENLFIDGNLYPYVLHLQIQLNTGRKYLYWKIKTPCGTYNDRMQIVPVLCLYYDCTNIVYFWFHSLIC